MQLTLREIPHFPPPWAYACAGRPDERRGRIAVRKAFVALKLTFTRAAAEVSGEIGQSLQSIVRQASEPIELWLIRSTLLAALPLDSERANDHRLAVLDALSQVYPGSDGSSRASGYRLP
ncbi:hypothetical protein [Roseateles sp.]|uniref:hypothetical protein n=1 Tax=Roseateles sp. TaxID=1971397 RepID=UPI003BA4F43A